MNVKRIGLTLVAAAALFSTPLASGEEARGEAQACDKAKTEACDKVAACDKTEAKACDKVKTETCEKMTACGRQAKAACGAANASGK